MSKLIAIKEGTKTRYVTQEVYDRLMAKNEDRIVSAGDITCSDTNSMALGFTEEQFNRIFRKDKKDE